MRFGQWTYVWIQIKLVNAQVLEIFARQGPKLDKNPYLHEEMSDERIVQV